MPYFKAQSIVNWSLRSAAHSNSVVKCCCSFSYQNVWMWYLQIWRSDSWPECKQYSSESFCHDWCIYYSPQHPFRFLNVSVLCLYVDQVQFVILTVSKWVFKWKGKRLGVYMLQNCKDSFSQLVGIKILPPLCPVEAMRRRWLNLCLAVVCVQNHPVLDIGDSMG